MIYCPIVQLAKQLISKPSLSPNDCGCQNIIIKHLKDMGFKIEIMAFNKTLNLWACHDNGDNQYKRTLAFVGHTDVVPAGDLKYWIINPFNPKIFNGMLYGRGSADMKGSLAAMIIAVKRFLVKHPYYKGRLAFIITSDEESSAKDGTLRVVNKLISRNERIDYCLIGEPSSNIYVGDNIKNGRRGSITANIIIRGIQGHVAYHNLAKNPIHYAIDVIKELIEIDWNQGKNYYPPTSMQIIDINTKNKSDNIIPGEFKMKINFRFNSNTKESTIKNQVDKVMQKHKISYSIHWVTSSKPFLAIQGKLVNIVKQAVQHYQGFKPSLDNTGGTSDGRFIINICKQIVELGPVNSTIHKMNECVKITDLQLLSKMYQYVISNIF